MGIKFSRKKKCELFLDTLPKYCISHVVELFKTKEKWIIKDKINDLDYTLESVDGRFTKFHVLPFEITVSDHLKLGTHIIINNNSVFYSGTVFNYDDKNQYSVWLDLKQKYNNDRTITPYTIVDHVPESNIDIDVDYYVKQKHIHNL